MAKTVKTYRVLKDGMKVGDSIRDFGDFMPEAENMETLRTLLNADVIEKVYVDEDAINEWRERQDEKDARWKKAQELGVPMDVLDDLEDEEDEEDVKPVKKAPKKKVTGNKKPVRKSVKKKVNTSERRLAEESV